MVTNTPLDSRRRITAPSVREIITPGMRMSEVSPLPPMGKGKPSTLLTTITATAQAAWAARTLFTKKHVPRSIRAILPLMAGPLVISPLSPSRQALSGSACTTCREMRPAWAIGKVNAPSTAA